MVIRAKRSTVADLASLREERDSLAAALGESATAHAAISAKLASEESQTAQLRAHIAALKQVLADVLAGIPHEYAKPETQLVRMRARELCKP